MNNILYIVGVWGQYDDGQYHPTNERIVIAICDNLKNVKEAINKVVPKWLDDFENVELLEYEELNTIYSKIERELPRGVFSFDLYKPKSKIVIRDIGYDFVVSSISTEWIEINKIAQTIDIIKDE